MKRVISIISACLPLLAAGVVVVQVIISNQLAGLGGELARIDRELEYQAGLHESLSMQVASASSLLNLSIRARELGFHEPGRTQIVTLTPEVPMALGSSPNLDVVLR